MSAPAKERSVLLCVTGFTTQVITETLYVMLVERMQRIDEVVVITTAPGAELVRRRVLAPHDGAFFRLCDDYGIDHSAMLFDPESSLIVLKDSSGAPLQDIRTEEDNRAAADQICGLVQSVTDDANSTLFASVAGGRKTMGVYLTTAMQLFGRAGDRLSHVLVDEEFEGHPDFHYIPPKGRGAALQIRDKKTGESRTVDPASARIVLADIPFIRLRLLLSGFIECSSGTYCDMVASMQEELALLASSFDLEIDLATHRVQMGGRSAVLRPAGFFWYVLYARLRLDSRGENGFVRLDDVSVDDLDATIRSITRAGGRELGLSTAMTQKGLLFLRNHSTMLVRDPISLARVLAVLHTKVNDQLAAAAPFREWRIVAHGAYGETRYGLDIPAEQLRIVG